MRKNFIWFPTIKSSNFQQNGKKIKTKLKHANISCLNDCHLNILNIVFTYYVTRMCSKHGCNLSAIQKQQSVVTNAHTNQT